MKTRKHFVRQKKKEEKHNKQTKRKAFFLPFAANRPGVNAAEST